MQFPRYHFTLLVQFAIPNTFNTAENFDNKHCIVNETTKKEFIRSECGLLIATASKIFKVVNKYKKKCFLTRSHLCVRTIFSSTIKNEFIKNSS
jgi:hypothetical protein